MIEVEGLWKRLAGEWVLRGIDMAVDEGSIVGIVGPSGSGKSVLLRHVIGLLVPDHGEVRIDGRSMAHARYRDLPAIRRRMGYVFQDGALLDSMTVRENLELALDDVERARQPAMARARVSQALERVNLDEDVLDRLPGDLSGGMRKRVAVARAIIGEPTVVLYDEPTTGLDPHNAELIRRIITTTRTRLGATSLVVTHDVDWLARVADRVAMLHDGVIAFRGTPTEFLQTQAGPVADFLGPPADAAEKEV